MKTKTVVLYGVLSAVILLMAFTPLGYLKTPAVEITFLMVPVVVGAITIGPAGGAVMGGVFGLTSFAQAFGMSAFGMACMAINPIYTFIMCVVPRVLAGWLAGLVFNATRAKSKIFSYILASLTGALGNTVLFVGAFLAMFGRSDYVNEMRAGKQILEFIAVFVGMNGIIEAIVTVLVASAIAKAIRR